MLRLKLEFGKKYGNYGYADITITAKEEDNYNNDKIFNRVLRGLNTLTDLDLEDAEGESEEVENGNRIYTRSIAYEFEYGLVVDTQKEIRKAFKEIKVTLNKIKGGSVLRK